MDFSLLENRLGLSNRHNNCVGNGVLYSSEGARMQCVFGGVDVGLTIRKNDCTL
jgi:hypothetical protein